MEAITKIPTAKEYIKFHIGKTNIDENFTREDLAEMFIEFAKLHVQQALKQASEKVQITDFGYAVNKDSILNAYSLENIK